MVHQVLRGQVDGEVKLKGSISVLCRHLNFLFAHFRIFCNLQILHSSIDVFSKVSFICNETSRTFAIINSVIKFTNLILTLFFMSEENAIPFTNF